VIQDRPYYYRLDPDTHKPIPVSADEIGEVLKDREGRQVARDQVGGLLVSTIFLGVDHGIHRQTPALFETMVFGLKDDRGYTRRYATWDEAVKGHAEVLAEVRKEHE
jgi:hypothetical protein